MIPGLLDSQIRGMTGREIAEREAVRLLHSLSVTLGIDGVHIVPTQLGFIAELANLIESVREAERK